MAFLYSVNNTTATGGTNLFIAMNLLISAGWVVKSSSDGTTYNSTGNQITSGNTGTGGYANSRAWFRIQAPLVGSQRRELLFQTPSGATASARIKYSASAGFIGGSPNATQVPSATDEVVIIGGGTDVTPTGTGLFSSDGSYRFSMMAGDASIGYSFYWFGSAIGSQSNISAGFIFDVLQNGSYNSLDTDPCVFYGAQNGTFFTTALGGSYTANGLLGTAYAKLSIVTTNANSNIIFPAGQGSRETQNIFSLKDELFPAIWGRDGAATPPTGIKGISSIMLVTSVSRTTLNTQTINSTRDRIILGYYSFPWNGSRVLQ